MSAHQRRAAAGGMKRAPLTESRLGQIESRLGQIESRLGQIESRLDQIESRHFPVARSSAPLKPAPEPLSPANRPRLMSVADAAKELTVSSRFLRILEGRGQMQSIRLGRRVLIHREEVDRLIREGVPPAGGGR